MTRLPNRRLLALALTAAMAPALPALAQSADPFAPPEAPAANSPRASAGAFTVSDIRVDGLQRILARAHHDEPARHLTLAVQLGDPTAHLRPDLDAGHVAQAHRNAGVARHQRNLAKVIERLQVTGGAHHVLGFA